jgi:hypothetical protein
MFARSIDQELNGYATTGTDLMDPTDMDAELQRDLDLALALSRFDMGDAAEDAFPMAFAGFPAERFDGESPAGPSGQRGGQVHADQRAAPRPSASAECVVCGDAFELSGLVRCPCSHLYCPECLKSLFVRSMTDESLFPPKCCQQEIPLSAIQSQLDAETIKKFASAAVEFGTGNRTYCANRACGKFIPPHQIASDRALCRACGAVTCALCNAAQHDGDCPKDEALQEVLQLADKNLWKRCSECKAMVELQIGCNHIT